MRAASTNALTVPLRRFVIGTALVALLSGLAWMAAHFLAVRWLAEAAARRMEVTSLRVHGASAMLALVAFGALLQAHILRGLRQFRNRTTGIVLFASVVALTVTGWGLYYLGDEVAREWTSDLHMAAGIAAALAFAAHRPRGPR